MALATIFLIPKSPCASFTVRTVVLVGESEIRELGPAFLGLLYSVVLILVAVPVPDSQAPVLVRQLLEYLPGVPRLFQSRRIVDPDVRNHRFVVSLVPDLDHLDFLAVARLNSLVLPFPHLGRVDDEKVAVPETDQVTFPQWIGIFLRRMTATVRVHTANLVHHLVDQQRLARRRDELLQKRLDDPARHARGIARTQRIVLDSALDAVQLLHQRALVLGREVRRR